MKYQLLVIGIVLTGVISEKLETVPFFIRKLRDAGAYIYRKDLETPAQVYYVNQADLLKSLRFQHGLPSIYVADYGTTPRTFHSQIANPHALLAYRPRPLPYVQERKISSVVQTSPVLFDGQVDYVQTNPYTTLSPYIHLPYSPNGATAKTVHPQHIVKYQMPEKSSSNLNKYKPLVKSVEILPYQGEVDTKDTSHHPYEYEESGQEHFDHADSGSTGHEAKGHYQEESKKYGKENSSKKGHHSSEDRDSQKKFKKGENHQYEEANHEGDTHEESHTSPAKYQVQHYIPLPFANPVPLTHIDKGESHLKETGGEYGEEVYGKKGEKSSSDHSSEEKYSKGKKEEYSEDDKKHAYEGKGKETTKYHDDKDQHGSHQEAGESTRKGEFGEKKKYKKGSKTEGYHNTFHKDEFVKDHTFYDDLDHSGHFRKYEKFHKDFHLDKAKKAEGDHLNKGYDKHHKANHGHYNKGHQDQHVDGYNGKNGHNHHHHHGQHFNKNGGKHHHNHHGYVYHH